MANQDIKSMSLCEIESALADFPKYRAKQVFERLRQGVVSFDEMTNIPKNLREFLSERYMITYVTAEKRFDSKLDETKKYLYRLHDDEFIESVFMKYKHGYTICISTQVGCRMGCEFCASGKDGMIRNLTPGEMLAQIEYAARDNDVRISNVVLMGMGEPLDNYYNVVRFLELTDIGLRHISLSTCGVVSGIKKLRDSGLPVTLSISLHAPNDEIRNKMMPINKKWGVEELIKTCRKYVDKTGRRISFEYALIKGVNDSNECAKELAERLKGMICHLNIIPVNNIEETYFDKPNTAKTAEFAAIMNKLGINTTVRRTLGADIDASCGQLRKRRDDCQ